MATDTADEEELDLHAGMVPHHNLGPVTGYDHDSGLPIVKRNSVPHGTSSGATDSEPAASDSKPSSKAEPVGKTDPESGRQVTQPTDKPAANQKVATEAMPEFKAALENIVNGIPGATLAATRAKKNPERLAEKIGEEGQPPETVSDYGAAQISVDTPAAKDAVIAAVKKAFKVLREDDSWDKGDPEYHYHAYSMQLQMPNGSSEELQILPKEGMEANDTEHSQYKKARDAKNEGEPAEAAQTQARSTNDAAMAKFNARNGQSSKNKNYSNENKSHSPEKFTKGQPVLANGKPAKIIYIHVPMGIARVQFDNGGSETVRIKALQPSTEHVAVAAHYRKAPGK